MLRLPALLACSLSVAVPSAASPAEGLVQLTFEGRIDAPTGGLVEVELDALTPESTAEIRVHVFLAPGTAAPALAELVERQLTAAGAKSYTSLPDLGPGEAPRADLFVERATVAALRMGMGLTGRITLCQGPPAILRVRPPEIETAPATLVLDASAWHPHTERRSHRTLEYAVAPDAPAARTAAELFQRALEQGWSCERPEDEAWQPVKLADGSRIVGFTAVLRGRTDARLEIEL